MLGRIMSAKPYRITASDKKLAVAYLERQIALKPLYLNKAERQRAIAQFNSYRHHVGLLNQWCETFLNEKQWESLKAAVRQRRAREKNPLWNRDTKRVELSYRAWETLDALARRDGVTPSMVVERYLTEKIR